MSDVLSVGQRVLYRRLGETEYRESTVRTIFPRRLIDGGERMVELATSEIVTSASLITPPDDWKRAAPTPSTSQP